MTLVARLGASEKGSVMMESIIMLPVMLIAFMAALQIAQILFARQLTEYAAISAARAGRNALSPAVAQSNALSAAKQVCSILSLTAPAGSTGALYALPWLGEVDGTQNLDSKLSVSISPSDTPANAFGAEVTMNFPLLVPVVNQFLSGLLKFRDNVDSDENFIQEGSLNSFARTYEGDVFPHITITRKAIVPANPALAD